MRHPARWAASLALIAILVAIALIALAGQAHKGTGVSPGVTSHSGLEPVALSQTAAHDYNPFGTGPENRKLVQNVVDSDPNTATFSFTGVLGNAYTVTLQIQNSHGDVGTASTAVQVAPANTVLVLSAAALPAGKSMSLPAPAPGTSTAACTSSSAMTI